MIRSLRYASIIFFLVLSIALQAQSEDVVVEDVVQGVAVLRKDIYTRKEVYSNRVRSIVVSLDTATISEEQKKAIAYYIEVDLKAGGLSSSMMGYDLLPKDSPYRHPIIVEYIRLNQDHAIDKGFFTDLKKEGVFTADGKINRPHIVKMQKDFEFLDVHENDRILLYNAYGVEYATLLGYSLKGIDLTIHNDYIDNHYLALDRIDRYPSINDGNVIEFLHSDNPRLIAKGQKWDKIIVREPKFLEESTGYILKSFHDNLSEDGRLYILHEVKTDLKLCTGKLSEEKIIKIMDRANFQLKNKLKMDCQTYFEFQYVSK